MSIKKIYSEVESEKKNKIKEKMAYMSLEEFIKEHKNLIEVLKEGSREELLAEAEKQEDELEKCLKKHGIEEED